MPLPRKLGAKDIHTDLLRITTSAGSSAGSVGKHALLGPHHDDVASGAPTVGAMIRGNSTPRWSVLMHPGTGGYALVTGATLFTWDQTPTWTGEHDFGAGWGLSGGVADLNGLDLVVDQDGDSYLHASADDVVDLVLAGAGGEFGIHIDGAEDFTFTTNAFNVLDGSAIHLSEHMYHAGDADTFLRFQADQVSVSAGGVSFLDIVEAAQDYVKFNEAGADVDWTVEAVGHADALHVQGDTGRVTVGTTFYGHTKIVTASGEIGNGPLENGEIAGIGGTTYIAPSARLYAAATIS